MKTYSVYIGLGSNLGDRHAYIARAVDELKRIRDSKLVSISSVYESDPFGKTDQPKFFNAAAEIETALLPAELLAELQSIEMKVGRTSTERWGPREIDLDILAYDGVVFEDEHVTVPHPGIAERKFVLVPLKEIAPDLVHPVSGMTVEELAAHCPDHGRVVKTTYHLPW